MDTSYIIVGLTIVLALCFDFINGFHDTANAIATAVSTKALTPRRAIMLAAVMNFLGAVIFTAVAKNITKDIINPNVLQNGAVVIMAGLISAIAWNLITWYLGIPSSSSHALIGSIAGAGIAAAGTAALNFKGFVSIIEALILSPLLAFSVGYVMFTI
ncbi:MAG: inorganic phosphate transporter, partial [Bacillota bacterium]|nr:inorganic phosphate transporter [Bacillota bacterium]